MAPMGIVVLTNGNNATVVLKEYSECEGCEFSRFCNIGKSGRRIICNNNKRARVGDLVEVDSTKKNLVIAGVLNFVFPLLLLIIGIIIGLKVWKSELFGFILAILFLILYFLIFIYVDKKIIKSGKIIPEVLRILSSRENLVCASCGEVIEKDEGITKELGYCTLNFCSNECVNRHLSARISNP